MSSEVEMLCDRTDCDLVTPYRIAVVKDQMYILHWNRRITVVEGKSHEIFRTHPTKKIKIKINLSHRDSAQEVPLLSDSQNYKF